jgi:aspartyl-tRNA(Asn)/glutamyl-tRNA(Gln) amidotransferase subunit C
MTTSLDETAVRHVAHLARLTVSDAEVARFSQQLSVILQYFEQLEGLDTTNVEPTAHPLGITDVLRDDVVCNPLSTDAALRNAPQHQDQLFQVPKVLDQDNA